MEWGAGATPLSTEFWLHIHVHVQSVNMYGYLHSFSVNVTQGGKICDFQLAPLNKDALSK